MLRLQSLWSWLPAFRAVAETEHLPSAARRMGVSAPALSRAIRLVEDQVGVPLFAREKRRLVLNDAGRSLLDSLRDAMRLVDDGWDRAVGARASGLVRIAVVSGAAGTLIVSALDRLRHAAPDVTPQLVRAELAHVRAGLLEGTIDLAIVERPVEHARLHVVPVAEVRTHVYCGRGSPLYRARHVDRRTIFDQPFVVPVEGAKDGWPVELPRRAGVVCDSLALAVELCAHGPWLAALPESVESMSGGKQLRRLAVAPGLDPVTLYVVARVSSSAKAPPSKIDLCLAALSSRA